MAVANVTSVLGSPNGILGLQFITGTSYVDDVSSLSLTASHTVTFTQQGDVVESNIDVTASDTLTFTQTNSVVGTRSLTASDTLSVTQTVAAAGPKVLTASGTVTILSTGKTSLLAVSASDILTLSQTGRLVEVVDLTATSPLVFTETSSSGLKTLSATHNLTLTQVVSRIRVGEGFDRTATSPLTFTQSDLRVRVKVTGDALTASNSLTFVSRGLFPIELTAENDLTFVLSADRFPHSTVNQSLSITQSVVLNKVKSLTVSQPLTLSHSFTGLHYRDGVIIPGAEGCKSTQTYSPFAGGDSPAIPAAVPTMVAQTDVVLYTPSGAIGDAASSVTLRTPNFSDRDRNQYNRINRESRGGTLQVYRDPNWPQRRTLVMDYSGIKDSEVSAILEFLRTTLGLEIGFRDWSNRTWYGIVVNPNSAIIRQGTDRNDMSLEIEINQSL